MPEKNLLVEKLVKKILEEVPHDLLELFYSKETPIRLVKICSNCGIEDEKGIEKISFQIGKILMGGLAPEKLLDALKKEAEIPSITAIKIFQEIDEQIFSSVRESLDKLYKKESPANKTSEEEIEKPVVKEELKEEEKSPTSKEADAYQEPIE